MAELWPVTRLAAQRHEHKSCGNYRGSNTCGSAGTSSFNPLDTGSTPINYLFNGDSCIVSFLLLHLSPCSRFVRRFDLSFYSDNKLSAGAVDVLAIRTCAPLPCQTPEIARLLPTKGGMLLGHSCGNQLRGDRCSYTGLPTCPSVCRTVARSPNSSFSVEANLSTASADGALCTYH